MKDQLLGILYTEFFYGAISILLLSNMPCVHIEDIYYSATYKYLPIHLLYQEFLMKNYKFNLKV